jgi:hypothetical protein
MAEPPIRTIKTANMMNVYGRFRATLTIHMMCSDRLPRDCWAVSQTMPRSREADALGQQCLACIYLQVPDRIQVTHAPFLKSDQIRSMQAGKLRNGIADASTSAVFSDR